MPGNEALQIIENLRQVFVVVLGLSLTEAFKQCVYDPS